MNKKPLIFMVSIILILIVSGICITKYEKKQLASQEKSQEENLLDGLDINQHPFIGDKNAPVTIIEFFDIKCPPCWQWSKMILPALKKNYIDTHKAKIIFVNNPLESHGKDSYLGSLALESAYQQNNKFFTELMEKLYNKQKSPDETWINKQLLMDLSSEIKGLDIKKFNKDIETKTFNEKVKSDLRLSKSIKVEGTPTIFINNKKVQTSIKQDGKIKNVSNPFDLAKIDKMIKEGLEKK